MYNNHIYTLINSDDKEKLIKVLSHLYETVIEKYINQKFTLMKNWIYVDDGTITYLINSYAVNVDFKFHLKRNFDLINNHLNEIGLKDIVDVKCFEENKYSAFGSLTISNKAEMKDIMLLMNLYKLKGII